MPTLGLFFLLIFVTGAASRGDPKWMKNDLTFWFNSTGSGMTEREVREAIRTAFSLYAAVTPLTFEEVLTGKSDIKIRFERGDFGDNFKFDGKGYVLAQSYFPEVGRMYFDADENWTVMNATNLPVTTHYDFLSTMVHETGIALGLSHSQDKSSVMSPINRLPVDTNGKYVAPKLDQETIKKIQELYGRASENDSMLPVWKKKDLTFSFNTTGSGMSESDVSEAVHTAFSFWAAVTPLTFQEVSTGESDIEIRFERGDFGNPKFTFDGPGSLVATTLFPPSGKMYFDADEKWTVMSSTNLPVETHHDFFSTFLHESGHALGLSHSQDKSSLMSPINRRPVDANGKYEKPKLDQETIKKIQQLYGTASITSSQREKN